MTAEDPATPLVKLGWGPVFEQAFGPHAAEGLLPARVAVQHRTRFALLGAGGEISAEVAGRFRHRAVGPEGLPVVGDWVAVAPGEGGPAIIQAILPRRTTLARKEAGDRARAQVLAANVDLLFLVTSLNREFNARRVERYLLMAWESGAKPVILLSKSDLCEEPKRFLDELGPVVRAVPVHVVSAVSGDGLPEIAHYFEQNKTGVLLGSSGVGKSTLINRLAGSAVFEVSEIRESDDKGRHTTTRREMILLPSGGLIIDTPGLREIQLWEGEQGQGLGETFDEIEALAANCRFRDCGHEAEPGCAVRAAIEEGVLTVERLQNYQKMQGELRHLDRKTDRRAKAEESRRMKVIQRNLRANKKPRDRTP